MYRLFCRFDIIGLGPDSPEDEEGIKASSEICKYGICEMGSINYLLSILMINWKMYL